MPQMAPISWMLLFILFSLIFIIFNIMNYYTFMNINKKDSSSQSFSSSMNNSLNWKW